MLEIGRMRVFDGAVHHVGIGFDHLRGDAFIDRTNERRERRLCLDDAPDPGHELRFGHDCSSAIGPRRKAIPPSLIELGYQCRASPLRFAIAPYTRAYPDEIGSHS